MGRRGVWGVGLWGVVLWGVGSGVWGVKRATPYTLHPTPYIFVVLLLSLVVVNRVRAHSELVRAEPGPGERVVAPAELRLRFSERVTEETAVLLFGANFQPVEGIEARLDTVSLQEVVVPLPPLPLGVYTVQWQAVGVDGHGLSGSYAFEVVEGGGGKTAVWLGGAGLLLLLLGAWWRRRAI